MKDIFNVDEVEILIRADGKVVWVNVNGVCELRCNNPVHLTVDDQRHGAKLNVPVGR